MPRNSNRGGRNNNPTGRNQYSGWMSTARENPVTAAAAVGGAVAAGVFLWSRRNQISDQIGNLSDQLSEWRDGFRSGADLVGEEDSGEEDSLIASPRRRSTKSQSDIADEALTLKETGKATG